MTEQQEDVRAMLPDWVRGTLLDADQDRVERALAIDADLREEADFLRGLALIRPEPSPELVAAVRARIARERVPAARPSGRRPTWQLSAAALVVIAAGTAVLWQRETETFPEIDTVPASWRTDDAVIAGGLVLDELSDDALQALATELER